MMDSKYVISAGRLFFSTAQAMYAKKNLIRELRKKSHSTASLGKAYNAFLQTLRKKEQRKVEMKSARVRFTRCPILSVTRPIGKYTVSRRAEEVLSETDIVCAIEHHKHGDWGLIDPSDWSKCNACLKTGRGYAYSRHQTSDGRFFCVLTDYETPKTKIIMEEELNEVRTGHGVSHKTVAVGTGKRTA